MQLVSDEWGGWWLFTTSLDFNQVWYLRWSDLNGQAVGMRDPRRANETLNVAVL